MQAEILVREVEEVRTRSGNTRYVVRDDEGGEYTTFRPQIGRQAHQFEGRHARISYHEEERDGFHNVYLDEIAAAPDEPPVQPGHDKSPEEAGWDAAVEAAPWLVGTEKPDKAVPPKRLYDKLRPFKDLVADDIRAAEDEDSPDR